MRIGGYATNRRRPQASRRKGGGRQRNLRVIASRKTCHPFDPQSRWSLKPQLRSQLPQEFPAAPFGRRDRFQEAHTGKRMTVPDVPIFPRLSLWSIGLRREWLPPSKSGVADE